MATADPTNQSAAELARVLARANLLQYYDVFIEQGGDDVQQLCEAGDEEFLEIMALVGMASKPLHVRRLQKALQEWVSNPSLFAVNFASMTPPTPASGSILAHVSHGSAYSPTSSMHGEGSTSAWSPRAASIKDGLGRSQSAPQSPSHQDNNVIGEITPADSQHGAMMVIKPEPRDHSPSPTPVVDLSADCSTQVGEADSAHNSRRSSTRSPTQSPPHGEMMSNPMSSAENSNDSTSGGKQVPLYYYNNVLFNGGAQQEDRDSSSPTPQLSEAQIQAIASAALELSKTLPTFEPKWMNIKKSLVREIEQLMILKNDDPAARLDKIRTYSAIYGRFDSKRKNEKQMSLHEISVNEASAQLCMLIPALLTRREELFPLARQIVRESGYQYAKGHSRSSLKRSGPSSDGESPVSQNIESPKKVKLVDPTAFTIRPKMSKIEKEQAYKEARLQKISRDLDDIGQRQNEIKASIEEAKLNADYERLATLTEDLKDQNARRTGLVAAQGELNRKKRPYNRKIPEHTIQSMHHDQASMMGAMASMGADHAGLVPRLDFHQFNVSNVLANVGPMTSMAHHASLAAAGMAGMNPGGVPGQLKQSLLDEGLRIATQYGMIDFAAELQGLRGGESHPAYQYAQQMARHQTSPPMRRQSAPLSQHMAEHPDRLYHHSPTQHSDSNLSMKASSNPDVDTHSNTSTPHNHHSPRSQRTSPTQQVESPSRQNITSPRLQNVISPRLSPKIPSGEESSMSAQMTEDNAQLSPLKAEFTDDERQSVAMYKHHAALSLAPPMPGLIAIKVEQRSAEAVPHSNGVANNDSTVHSTEQLVSVTRQTLPTAIKPSLDKEAWKMANWGRDQNTS